MWIECRDGTIVNLDRCESVDVLKVEGSPCFRVVATRRKREYVICATVEDTGRKIVAAIFQAIKEGRLAFGTKDIDSAIGE